MQSRRTFLRTSLWGTALLGSALLVGKHLGGYALAPALQGRLRALSAKEYLVLQAIVNRVLSPDGSDAPSPELVQAALHIDRYLAGLDEPLRRDVRALLHLVEHASGPLRGSATRFTRMSAIEQDAVLDEWADSGLALRRRGLQALRTLAFLGYYRDDRTWPLIGYSGPVIARSGGPAR